MKKILIAVIALAVVGVVVFFNVIASTRSNPENQLSGLPREYPRNDNSPHTLLFTGDIMLDRLVRTRIERAQDPLYPFLLIASTTRAADLTIGNLEGPVTDRGIRSGSEFSFRFEPVGTVNALSFAGFDLVSSANNHIFDYGRLGITDTIKHLRGVGIEPVGIGANFTEANAPFIKLVGDSKVAFLSYTNLYPKGLEAGLDYPGISAFRQETAAEQIKDLKSSGKADIVVVLFHGGTEYETHSNQTQRDIAHALIDAGADLLIGTHPHVTEETERYVSSVILSEVEGSNPHVGYIAYSLGNFIFDQNFSQATMQGLMVEATIADKKVIDFKEIPVKISPGLQPYSN